MVLVHWEKSTRRQPHKYFLTGLAATESLQLNPPVCSCGGVVWWRGERGGFDLYLIIRQHPTTPWTVPSCDRGETYIKISEMRITPGKRGKPAGWFWMTRSLNSRGSKVKLVLFRGGKGVEGVVEGGWKQDRRMLIVMEKFWGTKEATSSVWRCVEQTGPPLSLTPWSGGLATFILPSFPPPYNELVPPLSLLPLESCWKEVKGKIKSL